VFITQVDDIVAAVRQRVADNFATVPSGDYRLLFHVYGRDGVMGALEPRRATGHEIGLVIEAVAATQELADTICAFARSTMLHHGYPGRVSTAGNLAFPYSPSDFHGGPVYRFSLHHVLTVPEQAALFPVEVLEVAPDPVGAS
jgi:hypothetical protein